MGRMGREGKGKFWFNNCPSTLPRQQILAMPSQAISVIYAKKTTVLNTLVTMTLTSDVENSKN